MRQLPTTYRHLECIAARGSGADAALLLLPLLPSILHLPLLLLLMLLCTKRLRLVSAAAGFCLAAAPLLPALLPSGPGS